MVKKNVEFKTEIKDLLNLIINSLYSNKDIFLRELISNSSDAIDKLRFESLTKPEILNGKSIDDFKILIKIDKEAKILTLSDNGIGMTSEEIEANLGTIAKSGTREYIKKIKEQETKGVSLVGQFGVGFYSVFMAADRVEVISKSAFGGDAVMWESDAGGLFSIGSAQKGENGTDILIHLKEDAGEYLEEYKIRQIVKKFSDFIEYPIMLEVYDKEKKETKEDKLNSRKPIWQKDKSEVTKEEYEEFYKYISYDFNPPLKTFHYKAEGLVEFSTILFIPEKPAFDLFNPENKFGLSLYVNKVLITDKSDYLLPKYMRFIQGVVECNDLPLNVSREMVQSSPLIEKIKSNITKKVISELKNILDSEREVYEKFYKEFGVILKEGLYFDYSNKEKLTELLLFKTMTSDALGTLKEYVEKMASNQEFVYYLTGDNLEEMKNSPHLEIAKKKGFDVILMNDAIDEFLIDSIREFDGKKLKSINKGDLSELSDDEVSETEKVEYVDLLSLLKENLKEHVKDVRVSSRLVDSPCALVADEGDVSVHMEKILKSMNKDMPSQKKILELNIKHPLIVAMKAVFGKDKNSSKLTEYSGILYDQALLIEGGKVKDPAGFVKKVSSIMAEAIG